MACEASTCQPGQEKPIIAAKQYMKQVVDSLGLTVSNSNTQATLVTFNSNVQRPQGWTTSKAAMDGAIDGLCNGNANTCSGYTNLAGGLDRAYNILNGNLPSPQGAKVVILLTDGQGNRPDPEDDSDARSNPIAYQAAERVKGLGAKLVAIGFNGAITTALNGYASVDTNCNNGERHVYSGSNVDDLTKFLGQIANAICGDTVQCASPALSQPTCNQDRPLWDDVTTECRAGCRATVQNFDRSVNYRTCTNFCAGVGRKCMSGYDDTCSGTPRGCNSYRYEYRYTCQCGDPLYVP